MDASLDPTTVATTSTALGPSQPHSHMREYAQAEDDYEPLEGYQHGNGKVRSLQASATQHMSLNTEQEPYQKHRDSPSSPTSDVDHIRTRSDSPELVMLWETSDHGGATDGAHAEASPGKVLELQPR